MSVSLVVAACLLIAPTGKSYAADYHVVHTYSLPADDGWDYVFADSDANRVYVTRGSHLQVVNGATGAMVGDITGLSGIHGVAIDPKNGHGFISNGRSNTVTVFDIKTLQKIGPDIPVDQGPDGIIFDPATERVFTFNGRAGSSTAIDAATGKVAGTITLPGRPESAIADGKGHVYDNIEDKSEIVEIDAKALKITNTWSIAPGDGPSGISMDPKSRRIYSVCDNQMLVVSDADAGKVVTTLAIGNGPDACAFDPGKKLVFSPNGRDGTLSIFHEASPDKYDLVATVPTQDGARTMALDTKTHVAFVVTAKMLPPDPNSQAGPGGGYRRRFEPGTFVVLEVGG